MDKVQKIREEVARIQLYTQSEVLKQVLDYIDKVQEEPVSIWHDANEEQPEEYRTVVIWNPITMDGEVVTRCVEVYKGRIWAYIDDLFKL